VCKKIAAVIDANPLDIPFAAIYLPDENQEKARRICAVRVAPDSNALPEVLSVTEMTAKIPAWPLNETSETHQVIEINHLQSQIGSFRAPILGDEVETGIIYPLTRTWQQRPAGFLIAGLSPYRVFDADYRSFLELTGRQISNSIGDAYALELDQGNGEMFTEGTAVEVPSSRGPNPLDELPAMSRLNEFSNRWRSISDLPTLLQEVLRATMQLHNADFGDVQLYNEVTQCLEIVAYSGLDEEFLRYFKMVDASDTSAYGLALAGLCRIMIEDVTTDPVFEPHREIAAKTGFRAVQSTPLFEPNGDKPLGMLSTYFRDPRRLSERELVLTDLYARQAAEVISAKISEQRLRESRVRLQHAAELIGLCCYSWNPQTNALEWDAGLRSIWGLPPDALVDYGTFISGVHPDDRTRVEKAIAAAADPAGDGVYDMEHRVMSASHGVERWIATRGQTTFESSIPVAFFGVALDITERKRADQAREVLISELQHRTRNLLAVVGSIAAETIASTRSVQEFRSAFNSRLLSLARVQGLLSRSEEDITISQLVQLELSALGAEPDGARIIVEGPIICLPSRSVQILALALHELATNARKYGALATRDGRLSVTWKSIEEGQNRMLELEWRETGLAPRKTKTAAPHNGFGRSLIEEALPFQLSAQTELVINQEEVRCTISLALAGRGV
jgi:PAS domain S-box-containing protein